MNESLGTLPSVGRPFPLSAFVFACLVVSVWVNASEVFRYFVFIMPLTREHLAMVPDIAPMSWPVFGVWALWDTLLVVMAVLVYWLYAERFGATVRSSVVAGTVSWLFLFVLFWVAMFNMSLAPLHILAIALPLAWVELVVASLIARWCFAKAEMRRGAR